MAVSRFQAFFSPAAGNANHWAFLAKYRQVTLWKELYPRNSRQKAQGAYKNEK
jgi:hypothetical protein